MLLGSLLASIVVTTRGQEENLIEDYDDERAHNPQTIPCNGPVMHPLAFGTEPNWPLADTICCNNHAWAERPGYQDEVNGGRWMDSAIASSAPWDCCLIPVQFRNCDVNHAYELRCSHAAQSCLESID
jgi:hypothetical protein